MAARAAVRIIGGQLNGRTVRAAGGTQLRPSGARLREALFSCLGDLSGAHCLDLFAGSGVLGFTAASRGAAQVVFVEKDRRTAAQIGEQATLLQVAARVYTMPAARFLAATPATPFDVALLDPPFATCATPAAWSKLLAALRPHLAATARVYCEQASAPTALPGWRQLTARRVGAVHWQLLQAQ